MEVVREIPEGVTHIGVDFAGKKIVAPIEPEHLSRLQQVLRSREKQLLVAGTAVGATVLFIALAQAKKYWETEGDRDRTLFKGYRPLNNLQDSRFNWFYEQTLPQAKAYTFNRFHGCTQEDIDDALQIAYMRMAQHWHKYESSHPNQQKDALYKIIQTTIWSLAGINNNRATVPLNTPDNSFEDEVYHPELKDPTQEEALEAVIYRADGLTYPQLEATIKMLEEMPSERRRKVILRLANLEHSEIGKVLGDKGPNIKQVWVNFVASVEKRFASH